MDGVIFLLNQAGLGLVQANAEIARLHARITELEQQLAAAAGPELAQPPASAG